MNTDLDKISEIPETPTEDNPSSLKNKLIKLDKSKIKLKKPISTLEEPSTEQKIKLKLASNLQEKLKEAQTSQA